MSFFKRIFGGSDDKAGPRPVSDAKRQTAEQSAESARQAIQTNLDNLEKRLDKLQGDVDAKTLKIKALLQAQKKPQAMSELKAKKMLEKQMETLRNNSTRLYEQLNQLDTSTSTFTTLAALQQAAKAQKDQLKANNIENAQEVLDEIQETNDEMQGINDMLAQPTGLGMEIDEDELAEELNEIDEANLDEQLAETGPVPTTKVPGVTRTEADSLPSVPTTKAQAPKTAEDLELEALQREMGLEAA